MATATGKITETIVDKEETVTRIWRCPDSIEFFRGKYKDRGHGLQPSGHTMPQGKVCHTEKDVRDYVDVLNLRTKVKDEENNGKFKWVMKDNVNFQEVYGHETLNLFLDLDTDDPNKKQTNKYYVHHVASKEDAKKTEKEWTDTLKKLCLKSLKMSTRDFDRNVAISTATGPVIVKRQGGQDGFDDKGHPTYEEVEVEMYKVSLHVCINGFKMVFMDQKKFFKQEEWHEALPSIDYSIYRTKGLLKLLNNRKPTAMDKHARVKKAVTRPQSLADHVPTLGLQSCELLAFKLHTPVKDPKIKKMTKPSPLLDKDSPAYKKSGVHDAPDKAEVRYILDSIDPGIGRSAGWLNVGNFLKFRCKFEGARELFDVWSQGKWMPPEMGGTGNFVGNYVAEKMKKSWIVVKRFTLSGRD
jgi:hypothetical protein